LATARVLNKCAAGVLQLRILHRDLQPRPFAGGVALIEAPRIPIANSMPVPVSPNVGPGLQGRPLRSPAIAIVPPQACAIMSKARLCW
jgi:hypothetical protein